MLAPIAACIQTYFRPIGLLAMSLGMGSVAGVIVHAPSADGRCWNCKSAAEVIRADKEVKEANLLLRKADDNLICSPYKNGVASWYAGPFVGRLTANGERYTARTLTAAHRKLPFGTLVKVTYTSSEGDEKSIIVRINDRGPFIKGRELDLSLSAFKKLASAGKGLLHVALETCESEADQRVASQAP